MFFIFFIRRIVAPIFLLFDITNQKYIIDKKIRISHIKLEFI